MQTVNLQYNVPAGYSLEEFVAKVNSYVARLAKNKRGEEWAKKDVFDNVDDLMADLMKE